VLAHLTRVVCLDAVRIPLRPRFVSLHVIRPYLLGTISWNTASRLCYPSQLYTSFQNAGREVRKGERQRKLRELRACKQFRSYQSRAAHFLRPSETGSWKLCPFLSLAPVLKLHANAPGDALLGAFSRFSTGRARRPLSLSRNAVPCKRSKSRFVCRGVLRQQQQLHQGHGNLVTCLT